MKKYQITFPLGPFERYPHNPILAPQGESWESKDLFNPAAIVHKNRVYLLYRAEDEEGRGLWNGTSRIGLAVSEDGFHFERYPDPVLYPTEPYEMPGGCEDPRVVMLDDVFFMTYTAFDGETARLCLATSTDLIHWTKHGCLIADWACGPQKDWTKSGAIVPQRINGKYVMYFGDSDIWMAKSSDGIRWTPDTKPVMRRREAEVAFDSLLIEPGPTPVVTSDGILLLYNGARAISDGPDAGKPFYSVGQVLFSLRDPRRVLYRTEKPMFIPEAEGEMRGQVDFVVFAEGLVHFDNKWLLYYGMADSKIGVASLMDVQ